MESLAIWSTESFFLRQEETQASKKGILKGIVLISWSSRTFDLLFKMIIDPKRSLDLRLLLISGATFISDDLVGSVFSTSGALEVVTKLQNCVSRVS